jgi:predicted TPR repeat methyltransferase
MSDTEDPGLGAAYALETPDDSRRLYASWAKTYDTGFADAMDYRLPGAVARAFAAAGGRGPVLDIGAGTGLLGADLAGLGIGPIDGTDISPEMLAAAARKGHYRHLFEGDVTARLDVAGESYAGIVSSGTFTCGHVGPEAIHELLRIAAPGALFVLSVNAAHWGPAGFAETFEGLGTAIRGLALPEVPIYGPGADPAHRSDRAVLATFRRA